jgi:hypothetical protein
MVTLKNPDALHDVHFQLQTTMIPGRALFQNNFISQPDKHVARDQPRIVE